MNQKVKTILYHLSLWCVYLIYNQLILIWNKSNYSFHILEFLIMWVSNASIFYFQAFISIPIFVYSKRYFLGVLFSFLYLLLYLFINYKVYYVYFLDFSPKQITLNSDFYFSLFKKNVLYYIDFCIYGIAYWQFLNYNREKKKQQIENNKIFNLKIDYLKTQLNQIFLKEMLEYYRMKTQSLSLSLANSFDQFSSLIGFSALKESDFCLLNDEIKNVNNFIALNQERYDNKLKVQISITGETSDFYVPHLILLTLVENAFKHGNLKINPFIFELNVINNRLFLKLVNDFNKVNLTNSTRIGIKNINERLEILFGNDFKYFESVKGNKYVTIIELKNSNNEIPK